MKLPPDTEAHVPKICHLRRRRYLDILVRDGACYSVDLGRQRLCWGKP